MRPNNEELWAVESYLVRAYAPDFVATVRAAREHIAELEASVERIQRDRRLNVERWQNRAQHAEARLANLERDHAAAIARARAEGSAEHLREMARDLELASAQAESDPDGIGTCGWAYRMAAGRLRGRAARLAAPEPDDDADALLDMNTPDHVVDEKLHAMGLNPDQLRAKGEALARKLCAPNEGAEKAEELYYIQDTRSYVGNCVLWWGPNRKGYVCSLDEAGLYSREDAEAQARSRSTDRAWPKSAVDALAVRHVRGERLREIERSAESAGGGDAE